MTTGSTGRERDELDGLDGLESWDIIGKFFFFTFYLDERKAQLNIGISFGHFGDYARVGRSKVESQGSTADKHQPQALDKPNINLSFSFCLSSCATLAILAGVYALATYRYVGTSSPILEPVPYVPTSLVSQIHKTYTSLLIFADKH